MSENLEDYLSNSKNVPGNYQLKPGEELIQVKKQLPPKLIKKIGEKHHIRYIGMGRYIVKRNILESHDGFTIQEAIDHIETENMDVEMMKEFTAKDSRKGIKKYVADRMAQLAIPLDEEE